MARPITVTVGPLVAAVANGYAQSQSGTGGTPLTLNGSLVSGGIGLPDKPRRLIITPAGNESANFFTITGRLIANGPIVSEVLAGGNAVATQSALDWFSVISITPTSTTAAAVTAGTNGVASSTWIRLDNFGAPQVALQVDANGTVNYTVEQTLEDPNDATQGLAAYQLTWLPHAVLAAQTTTKQDNYAYVPVFTRCTLNSGTGSCRYTAVQSYAAPAKLG